MDVLIEKINKCVKQVTFNINIRKKQLKNLRRSNWITEAIPTSCEKKELLYKIWKASPGNNNLKMEYKKYEKILQKVIKEAKIMNDRKQVDKNINKPRDLWKIINQKIGKNNKKKKSY